MDVRHVVSAKIGCLLSSIIIGRSCIVRTLRILPVIVSIWTLSLLHRRRRLLLLSVFVWRSIVVGVICVVSKSGVGIAIVWSEIAIWLIVGSILPVILVSISVVITIEVVREVA